MNEPLRPDILRIAAEANVDPRTVEKAYKTGKLPEVYLRAIREAAIKLEVPPPQPRQKKS